MIGRADIEGSKGMVALDACIPQASYPYGNFSDTSSFKFQKNNYKSQPIAELWLITFSLKDR